MEEQRPTAVVPRLAAVLAPLLGLWWWLWRRCCRGGDVAWLGTPVWSADGVMTNVVDVNAFLDAEQPCYRWYPETVTQVVLGMDVTGGRPQPAFTLEYNPGAGSGETDVIVTRDIEGDDSVAAERIRLTFLDEAVTGGTDGIHRLVFGERQVRCHPGRGHTDFSTELCT